MAYNETLAVRMRKKLARKHDVTEKPMFGGLSFLLKGKMFCGVLKENLVVRIDPESSGELLNLPYVRPMDFTGRPMRGFLYVSPSGYKTDRELSKWVERSIDFVSSLPEKKKLQRQTRSHKKI